MMAGQFFFHGNFTAIGHKHRVKVYDHGNVKFSLDWDKFFDQVENQTLELMGSGKFCIFLGGDHSVTIPLVKAYAQYNSGRKIGFIHFDSHPDLCEEYEDSRWSHACPLKRVADDHITPRDLAQIGIRSYEMEVSPSLDTVNQITSWAGAKIIYEVLANFTQG